MTDTVAIKTEEIAQAYDKINAGGIIVSPTKVGYILVGRSADSLARKFDLKNRPMKKPAVVLTRYDQLDNVAEIPEKHRAFIDAIEKTKVLCGFIMKRKIEPFTVLEEKAREMSMRPDGTSCFVINHGAYSEYLVDRAVEDGNFILASSANQSGTGNNGKFEKIGDRILDGVDMAIEHNEYVAQRYQPESGEQGVMVSLMKDRASVIRKGLDLETITQTLDEVYGKDGWDMNHGDYA